MEFSDYVCPIIFFIALVFAVVAIALSSYVGERHGQCYGNKTCNTGLVCLQSEDRQECVKSDEIKYGPSDGGTR